MPTVLEMPPCGISTASPTSRARRSCCRQAHCWPSGSRARKRMTRRESPKKWRSFCVTEWPVFQRTLRMRFFTSNWSPLMARCLAQLFAEAKASRTIKCPFSGASTLRSSASTRTVRRWTTLLSVPALHRLLKSAYPLTSRKVASSWPPRGCTIRPPRKAAYKCKCLRRSRPNLG